MEEEHKDSNDGYKPSHESANNHNGTQALNSEKSPAYDAEAGERKKRDLHGDPFGDESDAEVKYRTMSWWQAAVTMIAETISLGILSLPSVLAAIGLVGGLILVLGLGIIATYTGYVIGQFKLAYPHVHNMADAGEVLFTPVGPRAAAIGREFFGAAQIIFLIMIMGSHILTWIIAFNTITGHVTCSIVWDVVGLIVLFLFTLPRTLKKVSYLSISSFFSFISELKDPNDYPKALFMLQGWDISMYVVASIVIYRYGGPDVKSPALGTTSPLVEKVAYGIALPTIVITGVINAHVAAKFVYVRMFRGTKHMSQRTFLAVGSWVAITLTMWVIAWILAESIPVFNDLLALVSALFASWFTYGLSGIFWLFLNKGQYFKNWKKSSLTIVNSSITLLGLLIFGIELYASGKAIHDDSGMSASWSCANNVGG